MNLKIKLLNLILLNLMLLNNIVAKGMGITSGLIMEKLKNAKSSSMADAYVSFSDGVNAIPFNPAGIGQIKSRDTLFTYQKGFIDEYFSMVSYAQKSSIGILGGVIGYYDGGNIELVDIDANIRNIKSQQDFLAIFSYAREIQESLLFGMSGKILYSKIIDKASMSFAGDIGFIFNSEVDKTSFGIALRNIGIGPRFIDRQEILPLLLQAGCSFEKNLFHSSGILLSFNGVFFVLEQEVQILIGAEYAFMDFLFLRGGYQFNFNQRNFSTGVGFKFTAFENINISIDLNMAFNNDLGNTILASVGMIF